MLPTVAFLILDDLVALAWAFEQRLGLARAAAVDEVLVIAGATCRAHGEPLPFTAEAVLSAMRERYPDSKIAQARMNLFLFTDPIEKTKTVLSREEQVSINLARGMFR